MVGDDCVLPRSYLERPAVNEANLSRCTFDDDMFIQVWDMSEVLVRSTTHFRRLVKNNQGIL